MTNQIDNMQDVLDSRDVIARIEELREEKDAYEVEADGLGDDWADRYAEEAAELAALEALAEQLESYGDWEHGETLIRESYFEEYAQELAEECGMVPDNLQWPCTCIDWEEAARQLKFDYTEADFDGVTYLMRA